MFTHESKKIANIREKYPNNHRYFGGHSFTDDTWYSGNTETEVLSRHTDWKISKEQAEEFLRFVKTISHLTPRKLTQDDIASLEGKCYRGTSLFLMLLSLYAFGNIYSIQDTSKYNPTNGIFRKSFLVAVEKKSAYSYANKYIDVNGSANTYVRYEKPIFDKFLIDNDLERIDFPIALLQPILLAFDNEPIKKQDHKSFESELYGAKPNSSFLDFLDRLIKVPELKTQFPLLFGLFSTNQDKKTGMVSANLTLSLFHADTSQQTEELAKNPVRVNHA